MINSYTGILHLYFFEMTGKEISKVFLSNNPGIAFKESAIPNFIINKSNNSIVDSGGYFQFIEDDDNGFILFDYDCADYIISEEINNMSFSDFINTSNILPFNNEKIKINEWDTGQIPIPTLFKVKITYNSYYDHEGGYDCDTEIEIDYLVI